MSADLTVCFKALLRHRAIRASVIALAGLQVMQWMILAVALWGFSSHKSAYQALVVSAVLIAISLSAFLTGCSYCLEKEPGAMGTRLKQAMGCLVTGSVALYVALQSMALVFGYTQPLASGDWPLGELYVHLAIGLLLGLSSAFLMLNVASIQWCCRFYEHRAAKGACHP